MATPGFIKQVTDTDPVTKRVGDIPIATTPAQIVPHQNAPQQTTPEDRVTISANAQHQGTPISMQVHQLHAEGETIQRIAQQLGISMQSVRSYLGIAATAAKA